MIYVLYVRYAASLLVNVLTFTIFISLTETVKVICCRWRYKEMLNKAQMSRHLMDAASQLQEAASIIEHGFLKEKDEEVLDLLDSAVYDVNKVIKSIERGLDMPKCECLVGSNWCSDAAKYLIIDSLGTSEAFQVCQAHYDDMSQSLTIVARLKQEKIA